MFYSVEANYPSININKLNQRGVRIKQQHFKRVSHVTDHQMGSCYRYKIVSFFFVMTFCGFANDVIIIKAL